MSDELKCYLDMTVREVLDFIESANAGKLAFNGPGPRGDKRAPFCCVFAIDEDAEKLSRKMLGSTRGMPKAAIRAAAKEEA